VESIDFSKHYDVVAEAYDVDLKKGTVEHEAVEWSDATRQWLLIPRRVTKEKKNPETWDSISTNSGVLADDPFNDFTVTEFGKKNESSGFVGIRYIPGTGGQIFLALKYSKAEEVSTIAVYHVTGKEILPDTVVAEGFYNGLEFL